jgi:alanine racemase
MTQMPDQDSTEYHARPNRFDIDLGAVAIFTRNIRNLVGKDAAIFAALKCNAYGFGLEPVARTVLRSGADALSMVDLANAIGLRKAGIRAPILIYPGAVVTAQTVAAIEAYDLIPSIIDVEAAATYSRHATRPLRIAAKVDIGQERLGFPAEEAAEVIARVSRMPNLQIHIIHSHPNTPEPHSAEYLNWQLARFEAMCQQLQEQRIIIPIKMIASSKILSITRDPILNAVDPGQMLFGPFRAEGDVPWPTARQAFKKLSSRLIHVRALRRQGFVDQAPFRMREGMRMGIIPMGSADGADRLTSDEVLVRGKRAKLIGKPSLEHTRLDLTDIPDAKIGDEVVLIGTQDGNAITPEEVAMHRGLSRIADLAMAVGYGIPRGYIEGC